MVSTQDVLSLLIITHVPLYLLFVCLIVFGEPSKEKQRAGLSTRKPSLL